MITAHGIAEKIWTEGFHDNQALHRQWRLFENIADVAGRVPDEVDYGESFCVFTYTGRHHAERRITFQFSRMGGEARLTLDGRYLRPTIANIREAFKWVDSLIHVPEVKVVGVEVEGS